MARQHWTRRQAIQRGGALLAGAAGLGAAPGLPRPQAGQGSSGRAVTTADDSTFYRTYISRPDLQPPVITVTREVPYAPPPSGYIFTAPHASPAQTPSQPRGLMIVDWNGEVVWYSPPSQSPGSNLISEPFDFNVQSYRGKPVLTWFNQQVTPQGGIEPALQGSYTVADATYTTIASFTAADSGFFADGHDCCLTPRGTAYITATQRATADLTPIGGPASAPISNGIVQEIDIATGDLVSQWSALDHIPVDETYQAYSALAPSTDVYHLNSIAIAPDGNLLISSRHTWTVYKVDPVTGAIIWRLGGKRSDFAIGQGAAFAWQHDVKPHGPEILSVFDNEAAAPTITQAPQSRAIFLRVDSASKRARLLSQYTRPGGGLSVSQGSTQLLEGGRVLVGWGTQPYFSEFAADGQMLRDGQLPVLGGTPVESYQSYRALSFPWKGTPAESPAAAAVSAGAGSGATVYASWNGATEVARWTVLAGSRPASLSRAAAASRTGFETAIPTASAGPCFVAVAEDFRGKELGRSGVVTLTASS